MKLIKIFKITIWLAFAYNIGNTAPSVNIRDAVLAEVKKYPKIEIQDLYKLAYQAAMGNEHIMADSAQALKYLKEELASIDSSSVEPLMVYLRSDSAIARINLRTFKAISGNSEKLFAQMMNTVRIIKPLVSMLKLFLNDIELLAEAGKIPFKRKDVKIYFLEMEQKNFPAVHHSKVVTDEYKPAYRIVTAKQFIIK